MRKQFGQVGLLTLLSRALGFVRDLLMAAIVGAGPVADAFFIAFRLPNHFRAIFAEGAFNTAYVPAFARVLETKGQNEARHFQDRIFTLMALIQAVLLLVALLFTPGVLALLAPGLDRDPEKLALAIQFTRIAWPYLLCIALMTVLAGSLNATGRFGAAAFAPVLMNFCFIGGLVLTPYVQTPGHAAAWGVFAAGLAQLWLLAVASARAGFFPRFVMPRLDAAMRGFSRALIPAIIGSMGVQIAMFADTIIASLLPAGAISALYYADRINQLPIGVIGIAAGTVVLPEMARRLAAGDEKGAHHAQNRAMEITLLLAMPCFVAVLLIPHLIMHALFVRGVFTIADADAAAGTLRAYAFGLPAFLLIRSLVAGFHARGDTRTPMLVSLFAIAVNIGLKLILMGPLAQAGLALATSAGAWINAGLVGWLAARKNYLAVDRRLKRMAAAALVAALAMAPCMSLLDAPLEKMTHALPMAKVLHLAAVGLAGTAVYFSLVFGFARAMRKREQ